MSLDKYLKIYESKTKRSKEIYEEARKLLPGGVAGNGAFMKPYPLYIDRAKGSKVIDVDGNEYIDLLCGSGPMILGHSPDRVIEAVKKRLDLGTNIILSTELILELAKKIIKHMTSIEMLRFVNSGSEATYMTMRAARAYTKKDKIAKFEGNYHGQHDFALICTRSIGQGPISNPLGVTESAGIPKCVLENIVILPYNNIEASISLIKRHAHQLAAVIMEPVAGFSMGAIPADKEFIREVRRVTEDNGVLLIFDEIVTGFRLSGLNGASAYYGVKPDLTALGKIIGGGFPIGAYGGRKDIMEEVVTPTRTAEDREKRIFSSGTFSGNPISMIAGATLIKELEENLDIYPRIDTFGEEIREGIKKLGKDLGVSIQTTGLGSIFHIHFADHPIKDKRDALKADVAKQTEFSMGLIANGVLLPPQHPGFTCYAHSESEIDQVLKIAKEVLQEMVR